MLQVRNFLTGHQRLALNADGLVVDMQLRGDGPVGLRRVGLQFGLNQRTALLRAVDGSWRAEGVGEVRVWLAGQLADLSALPV